MIFIPDFFDSLFFIFLFLFSIFVFLFLVPKDAIISLRTSYAILGEGWAMDLDGMTRIIISAQNFHQNANIDEKSLSVLFNAFDTDNNGLIDTLEFLTTLAITSGMDVIDKIFFVYSLYDFDGQSLLQSDALCSIFRSALKGLSKVNPTHALLQATPTEMDVVANSFFNLYYSKTAGWGYAEPEDFKNYCVGHPVVGSWLKYFSTVRENKELGLFRGVNEAGLKNIPKVSKNVPGNNLGYLIAGMALNGAEDSVCVVESDFDDFYTPSVRAENVQVEKYEPVEEVAGGTGGTGGVGEVAVEETKMEEKKGEEEEKGEGKEAGEGGEGKEGEEGEEGEKAEGEDDEEGKEKEEGDDDDVPNDDGEEEEKEEEAVEEDEGEEGEEGEEVVVAVVKPKILKAPSPFDSEDFSTK